MSSFHHELQCAEITEIIIKITKGVAPWDIAKNVAIHVKVSPDIANCFLSGMKKDNVLELKLER